MVGARVDSDRRVDEWERSEQLSFRIALAIALLPIPAAFLISWALGSPPWAPQPQDHAGKEVPVAPSPSHEGGVDHR